MSLNRTAMAALAAATICGAAQGAEMTLYKQPRFGGEQVTVTNTARDLAPLGIADQASSLVVRGGSWEACTQPDFNGDCRTLAPGKYATLDAALNHRIESVRQLERSARSRERNDLRDNARGYEPPGYGRGYESADNGRGYESPDSGRGYEPPDNGGWAYGNRDHPRGGDAWRP